MTGSNVLPFPIRRTVARAFTITDRHDPELDRLQDEWLATRQSAIALDRRAKALLREIHGILGIRFSDNRRLKLFGDLPDEPPGAA